MSFSFKRMIIVVAQGKQFGEKFPQRSHLKRKGRSNAPRRQAPELPNDRNRLSSASASIHGWEAPHHHCHFFHHPGEGRTSNYSPTHRNQQALECGQR
jgi:hypothetical protein